MPLGASLWLVPPNESHIDLLLSRLITKAVPQHFPELKFPLHFIPHLTLTSDIPKEIVGDRPQAWLDSLSLDLAKPPEVVFQSLDVGKPFFKKLTLSATKESLHDVASQVRAAANENGDAAAAERWAKDVYAPHVSLLYSDVDIDEEKRLKILQELDEVGIGLATEGALNERKQTGFNGWIGGSVVLVPTWKKVEDWSWIAERAL